MHSRVVAHTLTSIADLLAVRGGSRYQIAAYRNAARIVRALAADDVGPFLRSGALASTRGIGPSTLAVIADVAQTGQSSLLQQLRAEVGADAVVPSPIRYGDAAAEAELLRSEVAAHPNVVQIAVAGAIRRRCDVVRGITLVAACRGNPRVVAEAFPDLELRCVPPGAFGTALWRATGSRSHLAQIRKYATRLGRTIAPVADEVALYAALGLPYIEPELREGMGELQAAQERNLPILVRSQDIKGVLHVHSTWSDGKATIAELAVAARARGWSYIGISDHSQAAHYAGGLSREAVAAQHAEIDQLNKQSPDGFRILKGIEADILKDGRIDYDAAFLDRFDYVIASVHERFKMDRTAMTARILRALDDPHVTILGHPTGRKLLTRKPYSVDLDAILAKAAAQGVAIELNTDPSRLDLDWRTLRTAASMGCLVSIGPDAHSVAALANVDVGIGLARKAWLEPTDLLNSQ